MVHRFITVFFLKDNHDRQDPGVIVTSSNHTHLPDAWDEASRLARSELNTIHGVGSFLMSTHGPIAEQDGLLI